ncbi:hypothetical protein [Yinghuangia sp. YIM S10712]
MRLSTHSARSLPDRHIHVRDTTTEHAISVHWYSPRRMSRYVREVGC